MDLHLADRQPVSRLDDELGTKEASYPLVIGGGDGEWWADGYRLDPPGALLCQLFHVKTPS